MGTGSGGRAARFTTGELARLIGASRNTVVRYIEEGRLRARRTAGGWYVVDRGEAVDFLWDLAFSKQTPLRIWQAASVAYEKLVAEDEAAKKQDRAKVEPRPSKARRPAPAAKR